MRTCFTAVQFAVALAIVLLVAAWPAAAKDKDIDATALTQETQKIYQAAGNITLVWWIPEDFWCASFKRSANLTPQQTEDFLKVLRPYVMIAVVKGQVGFNPNFESLEFVRSNTKVIDGQGNSYDPLPEKDVDARAKGVVGMLKPVFAANLGSLGQSMHIVFFPGQASDGNRLVDPRGKGQFKVTVADQEFRWRLPLDSILPSQTCAKCKEECKGSWTYCPWCGTKLKR